MKNYQYKLVILDEKKEIYSSNLSFYDLEQLSSNLDDSESSSPLFHILSNHPSENVRENIAYKDNLNEETFEILSNDKSINVLRRLINSDAAKKYASNQKLIEWINLDSELAKSIASYINRYENGEIDELAEILSNHIDPSVASELANNSDTPKKYLKKLLKHQDSKVAKDAKNSLS